MADGEAFVVGFGLGVGVGVGVGDEDVSVRKASGLFEPDLTLSEGHAFMLDCPLMKSELATRRDVVSQVRSLAMSVENAGYRRAAALLLEVAQSIKEILVGERTPAG